MAAIQQVTTMLDFKQGLACSGMGRGRGEGADSELYEEQTTPEPPL